MSFCYISVTVYFRFCKVIFMNNILKYPFIDKQVKVFLEFHLIAINKDRTAVNIELATEAIYNSLDNDNEDIDLHIENLKSVMKDNEMKEALFKADRLPVKNREGRKTMQAYFKKRGVKVVFEK